MTDFPDLLSMTPIKAASAWRKWLAARPDFEGDLAKLAKLVTGAISGWKLNIGREAEESSRKYLADKIETFRTAYDLTAD